MKADGIILNKLSVSGSLVEYSFQARGVLEDYFTCSKMFISYDKDMESVPRSVLAIPFVASLLPLMWLTDTVMWVEELDRTFYESVSRIKAAYQNLYGHCQLKGNLVPARIVDNGFIPKRESLLLFSGGIDANATYVRIENTNPILFNIQGWLNAPGELDAAAAADKRDIKAFSEREGREFHFAESNFAILVDSDLFDTKHKKTFRDSWWHGFQHSMSFISIAIPLAYLEGARNIYIASSVPMGEYVMCASHVTTDSEFRFSNIGGCVHDGSELTRQDKVRTIVRHLEGKDSEYPLRVCSFNDHNCCACDKCFRSILGIVAEGGDVSHFGFEIEGSLKNHFESLMSEQIVKFNISGESKLHWPAIRKRMEENRANIPERDFVDWFLSYDFVGERKKALRRYYAKNFFSILRRKLLKK